MLVPGVGTRSISRSNAVWVAVIGPTGLAEDSDRRSDDEQDEATIPMIGRSDPPGRANGPRRGRTGGRGGVGRAPEEVDPEVNGSALDGPVPTAATGQGRRGGGRTWTLKGSWWR